MKPCGLFFKHIHNAFEKILKKKRKTRKCFFVKSTDEAQNLKKCKVSEFINWLPNAIDCNVLPSKLQPVKHFKAEIFFFSLKQ